MTKDPAFLFYYQDYMIGTRKMTFEEKGAYMDLLCEQADSGHFSDSDIDRILNVSKDSLWKALQTKFRKDDNGLWFNSKLDEVLDKRRKHSEHQKENVSKRWNRYIPNGYQTDTKVDTKSIPAQVIPLENENRNEINSSSDLGKIENPLRRLGEILSAGPACWINDEYSAGQDFSLLLAENPRLNVDDIIQGAKDYREFCEAVGREPRHIMRPGNWLAKGEWKIDWKANITKHKSPKSGRIAYEFEREAASKYDN